MLIQELLKNHLGLNDFNPLIIKLFHDRDKNYVLSFFKIVVDEDKIPKDEYAHIDKKFSRIREFQQILERDVKKFKKLMSSSDQLDNDAEQNLRMARRIYSSMIKAQNYYAHHLGINVADWRRLAKSRAVDQVCIVTYSVNNEGICTKMPTANRPTFPIGMGVSHYAINTRPLDCDVQIYSSFQAFQLVGSGHGHDFKYSNGVLSEVATYQTYVS